jgi:hypothetical protein
MVKNSFQGCFFKKDRSFSVESSRAVENVKKRRGELENTRFFCPREGVEVEEKNMDKL